MGEKNDKLKIVPFVEGEKALEQPKGKKPTKAQIKKAEKEKKEAIKKQAEEQAKAMDEQIKMMGESVSKSICNQCKNCENPNKDFDRFKVKSSRGDELYAPMNFCNLAGLSLVDVQECEKFEAVKSK